MKHIPENIKFLILKHKNGVLNDQDRRILEDWYNEELPNELYWYGDTELELKARIEDHVRLFAFEDHVKIGGQSFLPKALVASIVAFFLLFFAVWFLKRLGTGDLIESFSVRSAKMEVTKVILPDHTIVWLKSNSILKYPRYFSGRTREVELEGEALFEVSKDKTKPFVIRSGNYITRVLGTSFNLKAMPDNGLFDLNVFTGSVEVTKKGVGLALNKKYTLSANESLYSTDTSLEKISDAINKDDKKLFFQGTQYDMNFISTPMEEIMKRFEEKFDVTFIGYTGEYSACKVTANLTDQSFESSLKIISMSINATYKVNKKEIRLTGGGCF